jgi:uncharacterized membrane protein YwzB
LAYPIIILCILFWAMRVMKGRNLIQTPILIEWEFHANKYSRQFKNPSVIQAIIPPMTNSPSRES